MAGPLLVALAPSLAAVLGDAAERTVLRRSAPVRRIFLGADQIARPPYTWRGGHGSFGDAGYDCSGSVSCVLHAAGLLARPDASAALSG